MTYKKHKNVTLELKKELANPLFAWTGKVYFSQVNLYFGNNMVKRSGSDKPTKELFGKLGDYYALLMHKHNIGQYTLKHSEQTSPHVERIDDEFFNIFKNNLEKKMRELNSYSEISKKLR